MMILEFSILPGPQTHPKSIPGVDSRFELCVNSQIMFYGGLWTMFYANFRIVFCTIFYFDYGPAAFLSTHQVCPDHSAGLWQFPRPSGGQPTGPPHTLAEELNPFCSQGHLRHQQRMSAFAAFPEVKRGSPGLLFSFSLLLRRGTLVLCLRDKHYGTCPSVLFGMSGTLSGARWIHPPQKLGSLTRP